MATLYLHSGHTQRRTLCCLLSPFYAGWDPSSWDNSTTHKSEWVSLLFSGKPPWNHCQRQLQGLVSWVILNLAKLTLKIRNHTRMIHSSSLVTFPSFYISRLIGIKHYIYDKHKTAHSRWRLYPLIDTVRIWDQSEHWCYRYVFCNESVATSSHLFTNLVTTALSNYFPNSFSCVLKILNLMIWYWFKSPSK